VRYEDFEGSSHRVCLFLSSFLFGEDGDSAHNLRLKELVRRTRVERSVNNNDKRTNSAGNSSAWSVDDMIAVSCTTLESYQPCPAYFSSLVIIVAL
jgi:hypothetical protein